MEDPVRVRHREGALALPAPAGLHEPPLPEHGDVGRTRDLQGIPPPERLRRPALRPRAPERRRHDRARPGHAGADHRGAGGHRRLRDAALHRAGYRMLRAGLLAAADGQGGPGPLVGQEFYWGINDPLGANHTGRPFESDGVHALRCVELVVRPPATPCSGPGRDRPGPGALQPQAAGNRRGIRSERRPRGGLDSRRPAPPATTRRMPGTTPCRLRCASASTRSSRWVA